MKCPRDGAALFPRAYEDEVYVDACPGCGGMMLDRGELEKIEEAEEHDYAGELARIPDMVGGAFEAARQKAAPDIACPACGAVMEKKEYVHCSQVIINKCPSCGGVWLDRGEIEALEIFYERSRREAGGLRRTFLRGLRR